MDVSKFLYNFLVSISVTKDSEYNNIVVSVHGPLVSCIAQCGYSVILCNMLFNFTQCALKCVCLSRCILHFTCKDPILFSRMP